MKRGGLRCRRVDILGVGGTHALDRNRRTRADHDAARRHSPGRISLDLRRHGRKRSKREQWLPLAPLTTEEITFSNARIALQGEYSTAFADGD